MNKMIVLAFLLVMSVPSAFATVGDVKIISPINGATVDSDAQFHVVFIAKFDSTGDHVHLYVDGKGHETLRNRAISRTVDTYNDGKWQEVSREIDGKKALGPLAPGKHRLCVGVVDSSHKPTGLEKCISIVSK